MRFQLRLQLALMICLFSSSVIAQSTNSASQNKTSKDQLSVGRDGGSLKQIGDYQIETVVSDAGIEVHIFDADGEQVQVSAGQANVHFQGAAKSYRYDLRPTTSGSLTAIVDFSKHQGKQAEISMQLAGFPKSRRLISVKEVATIPFNQAQLAAAAVSRQKTCPVSGQPLGSMGSPIAVSVSGKKVYVCCQGCVKPVIANPSKYLNERPEILILDSTEADSDLIAAQVKCPVMDAPLGSMGNPVKVLVSGKPIFLCCRGCLRKIKSNPEKYVAMVHPPGKAKSFKAIPKETAIVIDDAEAVRPGVYRVTAADKPFIEAQKKCPVMDEPLDAMGGPYKVLANGKAIYICCPGCAYGIAKEPGKYVALLADRGVQSPTVKVR